MDWFGDSKGGVDLPAVRFPKAPWEARGVGVDTLGIDESRGLAHTHASIDVQRPTDSQAEQAVTDAVESLREYRLSYYWAPVDLPCVVPFTRRCSQPPEVDWHNSSTRVAQFSFFCLADAARIEA